MVVVLIQRVIIEDTGCGPGKAGDGNKGCGFEKVWQGSFITLL